MTSKQLETKIRKFCKKNKLVFEPDRTNEEQDVYFLGYNHIDRMIMIGKSQCMQSQFTLPHFENEEDCVKVVENLQDDLLSYFGINA